MQMVTTIGLDVGKTRAGWARLAATLGSTRPGKRRRSFPALEIPVIEPKFPALRKAIPRSLDQGIVAEVAVMLALLPLKSGA